MQIITKPLKHFKKIFFFFIHLANQIHFNCNRRQNSHLLRILQLSKCEAEFLREWLKLKHTDHTLPLPFFIRLVVLEWFIRRSLSGLTNKIHCSKYKNSWKQHMKKWGGGGSSTVIIRSPACRDAPVLQLPKLGMSTCFPSSFTEITHSVIQRSEINSWSLSESDEKLDQLCVMLPFTLPTWQHHVRVKSYTQRAGVAAGLRSNLHLIEDWLVETKTSSHTGAYNRKPLTGGGVLQYCPKVLSIFPVLYISLWITLPLQKCHLCWSDRKCCYCGRCFSSYRSRRWNIYRRRSG